MITFNHERVTRDPGDSLLQEAFPEALDSGWDRRPVNGIACTSCKYDDPFGAQDTFRNTISLSETKADVFPVVFRSGRGSLFQRCRHTRWASRWTLGGEWLKYRFSQCGQEDRDCFQVLQAVGLQGGAVYGGWTPSCH